MSELSLAYIFHHQQLLVDQNLQLPKVEKLASDLLFTHNEQVIARDLMSEEAIPEGLQLVPIRQLISNWSKSNFYRQVVLYNCSNGGVTTSFVVIVDMPQKSTQVNMQWCALLVGITSILVSIHALLLSLLKVMMKCYWRNQFTIKPTCMV